MAMQRLLKKQDAGFESVEQEMAVDAMLAPLSKVFNSAVDGNAAAAPRISAGSCIDTVACNIHTGKHPCA